MALRAGVLVSAGRRWFPVERQDRSYASPTPAASPGELEAVTRKLDLASTVSVNYRMDMR